MTRIAPPIRALLAAWLLLPTGANAQLTVQNNLTPEDLVNSILVGQGVSVSNVVFNGAPGTTINDQIGSFDGQNSNLGLNTGLVLATGRIEVVEGPNLNQGASAAPASPYNHQDPDLGQFVFNQRHLALLEFDFVPVGDTLSFRFIFGSEEYPAYVCSSFNDGFGFFISGPGINGPFSNNGVNLAVVPGTHVPVAINTVNSGTVGMLGNASNCTSADPNWQSNSVYFVANDMNIQNPWNSTVELNGFTVPLTAGIRVECGQTYHIKIAIADATDPNLDSAVFVEGGSFSSTSSVQVTAETPQGDGTLTEGCGEAMITVKRPGFMGEATVDLEYFGNGITGGDLQGNLDSIEIPDGSNQASFPISAVRDGLEEGPEELFIVATINSACGLSASDTISITLLDYTAMQLAADDLWLGCDRDTVDLQAHVQGGLGQVQLGWEDGRHVQPYWVSGYEDRSYTVYATDECPETIALQVAVHSGCVIWVPNVITPNGDGHNDAWVIGGLAKSGSQVKVFNRWGNLVYESANYGNNWRPRDIPDGTYFYEVIDGRTGQRFSGHLTVLDTGK